MPSMPAGVTRSDIRNAPKIADPDISDADLARREILPPGRAIGALRGEDITAMGFHGWHGRVTRQRSE